MDQFPWEITDRTIKGVTAKHLIESIFNPKPILLTDGTERNSAFNNFLESGRYNNPQVTSNNVWPSKFFDWNVNQNIDEVELSYTLDVNAETFIENPITS